MAIKEFIQYIREDWKTLAGVAVLGIAMSASAAYNYYHPAHSRQNIDETTGLEQKIKADKKEEIKRQIETASNIRIQHSEYKHNQEIQELEKTGREMEQLERLYLLNNNSKDAQLIKSEEKKLRGMFSRLNSYRQIIEQETEKYNSKFAFPEQLTPEHIYRIIMVEAPKGKAFIKDPMQVANRGDHALRALANKEENTQQIDDFSYLRNIKPTKIEHWKREYDPNLTSEDSIKAGIGWLVQKAAVRDKNGKIIGWRSWEKATERYNGKGDENYMDKILSWTERMRVGGLYSES